MTGLPVADLEAMAELLNSSGDYRVQRRLKPRASVTPPIGVVPRRALFVDVETTGLDAARDEIIELAMVPFTYGPDGQIYDVGIPFQGFQQPKSPIPAEISKLTGITNEMVLDQSLNVEEISKFVDPAALIVAHNANFDRRFLERLSPTFELKPWACSQTQIDWAGYGIEGTRLSYLLSSAGFFYDKHRAVNDCLAAIELLATPMPGTQILPMQLLLECARKISWRIWAEYSPFELKDVLRRRGYRWNGVGTAQPKAWFVDVEAEAREAEVKFLEAEIYQREVDLLITKIDAYNRFSDRS